jgi:hypothetical protein
MMFEGALWSRGAQISNDNIMHIRSVLGFPRIRNGKEPKDGPENKILAPLVIVSNSPPHKWSS